ncbi:MAG: tetratricopeptide repeat protein [Pirellulales bacterium]
MADLRQSADGSSWLTSWDELWTGPVAAIRPYLFMKCFYLLIATDAVVLMTERGARYGVDGFNVAHFRWLDTLQPAPSATWYVGCLMLVAVLALLQVFAGFSVGRAIATAVGYTYCWTMSRYDSYLHHYLTSLILTALIFFPRTTAVDILVAGGLRRDRGLARGERLEPAYGINGRQLTIWTLGVWGLIAVYRIPPIWNTGWLSLAVFLSSVLVLAATTWRRAARWSGPATSAPAFRMLAATVGIVYIYTSIAKMDSQWCRGYTLQQVGDVPVVLGPVATWLETWGLPRSWFWSLAATAVIPLELTLAASYFAATVQDEPWRKWPRRLATLGWLLAMGLHFNNEMMGLTIQWFSYYMIFLACFFLLPAEVVWCAGGAVVWPAAWATSWLEQVAASTGDVARRQTIWLGGWIMSVSTLAAAGWWMDIPGGHWALPLAAAAIGATAWLLNGHRSWLTAATLLRGGFCAGLFLIALVSCSSVRFDYYSLRGRTQQHVVVGAGFAELPAKHRSSLPRLEQLTPAQGYAISQLLAIESFERALRYNTPRRQDRVDVLINLGLAHRILGNYESAQASYERAIAIDRRSFLAYYNLGVSQQMQGNQDAALQAFQAALEIKPDLSDAWMNIGLILEQRRDWSAAIQCYERALEIEPQAADIGQRLEAARAGRDGQLSAPRDSNQPAQPAGPPPRTPETAQPPDGNARRRSESPDSERAVCGGHRLWLS